MGIYHNLSVWYKVTDRTKFGAYISSIGAILTLVINIGLIPKIGYMASALATLAARSVVGIAAMKDDQPIFRSERGLLAEGARDELMASGCVAEVVGHFLDTRGQLVDHPINRRTIGLSFAELARQNVLAAVAGAHKATAIHAVLQSGLVDRLIIDAPAANALERLAAEQPT